LEPIDMPECFSEGVCDVQQKKGISSMKRSAALLIATALVAAPAAAQTKGKSGTAPGKAETTPGQMQNTPGDAKTFAPGRSDNPPPGQAQRDAPNPSKKTK
jgi:hypothetical protein